MMRRGFAFVFLLISAASFSLETGLVIGPFANEEEFVQRNSKAPIDFYDIPCFFGGFYISTSGDELVYTGNLLYSLHFTEYEYELTEHHILYSFHDVCRKVLPFLEIGAGAVAIVMYSDYPEDLTYYSYYISTELHPVLVGRIETQQGKFLVGAQFSYQLDSGRYGGILSNHGYITAHIGLRTH